MLLRVLLADDQEDDEEGKAAPWRRHEDWTVMQKYVTKTHSSHPESSQVQLHLRGLGAAIYDP